jgi:hypothetical protein
MAAIPEIVRRSPAWRMARLGRALCVLGAVFLLASEAAAGSRVSLMAFDGDSARPLRWRVAQVLKRAGHTVLGFKAPRSRASSAALRAYAKRRNVDVFISGSSVEATDGWELSLNVRGADGEPRGSALTFTAPSLGELVKDLKAEGQERLDRALGGSSGSGAAAGSTDLDLDAPAEADVASADDAPTRRQKNKARSARARQSRAIEEPTTEEPAVAEEAEEAVAIDVDESSADTRAESKPRKAKANWLKTKASPRADAAGAGSLSMDESAPEATIADEPSPDASAPSGKAAWPSVVLGAHAGFVRRTLGYVDDLYGRLRAPSANSWVYRFDVAVFPFARPVKDRIGLIGSYEAAFSGTVRDSAANTDFPVTFSELFGGVRLRQPLGKHEIGLQGTFGTLQAGLQDPQGTSGVPEYSYTLVRSSADLGLHFGDLSLSGSIGYRAPIGGYGQVSEVRWFPRIDGYGVEGMLGLQYRFSKEVALDVSGSMRRFVLEMNSRPEDARTGVSEVAAGAIDLYVSGYFGLAITL